MYCVVFSATTQKCKRIGVFEMVCLTLEGIRCIVPMPKEQWHTEKAAGKNALLDQAFCTTLLKLQYLVQEPVWIVGLAKMGDYVLAWGYLQLKN